VQEVKKFLGKYVRNQKFNTILSRKHHYILAFAVLTLAHYCFQDPFSYNPPTRPWVFEVPNRISVNDYICTAYPKRVVCFSNVLSHEFKKL
jgi:hypothetical protein